VRSRPSLFRHVANLSRLLLGTTNTFASAVLGLAIYVTCLGEGYSWYTIPAIINAALHLVFITAM